MPEAEHDPYRLPTFMKRRQSKHHGEIAIQPFLYTWGLCCHADSNPLKTPYQYRYCYESLAECLEDFEHWDDEDHPPGNWIKRKSGIPKYPELSNPNYQNHENPKMINEV